MSVSFHLSRRALWLLIALPLTLAGCGPIMPNLGNDPCLLQAYQGHANGNLSGMQTAYGALSGRLDALQSPDYTIGSTGDISETLQNIVAFQFTLDKQLAYLNHTAPQAPREATPFLTHIGAAISRLNTGAYLLAQAYLDAHDGHAHTAQDIADEARGYMRRGAYLLYQAGVDLANLHTDNVNC